MFVFNRHPNRIGYPNQPRVFITVVAAKTNAGEYLYPNRHSYPDCHRDARSVCRRTDRNALRSTWQRGAPTADAAAGGDPGCLDAVCGGAHGNPPSDGRSAGYVGDGECAAGGGCAAAPTPADTGAPCFGAYFRDNSAFPATFPTNQDVRVMWKYWYDSLNWMGTEAGQVTGRNGSPQYYGLSGVNNGAVNYYHVEANGPFGQWDLNNPLWKDSAVGVPHTATFDFICDGQQLDWWVDVTNIHSVNNGTPLPPNDPRPPLPVLGG